MEAIPIKKYRVKKGINLLLVLIALVIPLLLASCGTGKSALVGAWNPEIGGKAPDGFPDSIQFLSDGTCEIDGFAGNYSITDGKLKITVNAVGTTMLLFDYEIAPYPQTITSKKDNPDISLGSKDIKVAPKLVLKNKNKEIIYIKEEQ